MHVQFIKAELHIDDLLVGDIVHLSADVRILKAGDRFVSQAGLTDCTDAKLPGTCHAGLQISIYGGSVSDGFCTRNAAFSVQKPEKQQFVPLNCPKSLQECRFLW